jgi:chromate transport protein ChrA
MGLVPFFDKLSTYPKFRKVINGILCSFVGLLAITTWHFAIDIHWTFLNILLAVIAFVILMLKVDVIWIILGAVVVALIGF